MRLKDMVNKDTVEIIKKLVYGLDYNTIYVVEFYRDTSVEVREVKRVIDKETNEIIYVEKWKEWLYDNFTDLVIYSLYSFRFSFADYNFNGYRSRYLYKF